MILQLKNYKGWQNEENKKKYGTTYILIEQTVENYLEKIDSVVTQDDLDSVMKEAREALQKNQTWFGSRFQIVRGKK